MSLRVRRFVILASFLLAVPLAGCKQGIGDRCQLDSDCDSGRCVLPTGGSPQQGGTCKDTTSGGGDDLSANADLSAAPADLSTAGDSATGDLAGGADMTTAAGDMSTAVDAGTDASLTDGASQD